MYFQVPTNNERKNRRKPPMLRETERKLQFQLLKLNDYVIAVAAFI